VGGTYIIGKIPNINAIIAAYINGNSPESLFNKEIKKDRNKKTALNKNIKPIYRMII